MDWIIYKPLVFKVNGEWSSNKFKVSYNTFVCIYFDESVLMIRSMGKSKEKRKSKSTGFKGNSINNNFPCII